MELSLASATSGNAIHMAGLALRYRLERASEPNGSRVSFFVPLFETKKGGGYLRFLYRCVPSIVWTYWNPFSIRSAASFALVAVLHVYSSSPVKVISCV